MLKLPAELFSKDLDEGMLEKLAVEHAIAPIELQESEISVDAEEAEVDVSRDPMRNMFRRPGPLYIAGQRVRYIIPFSGDPIIFQCRPSSFNLNPPRAQIEGSEVVFEYLVPLEAVPQTRRRFEEELASLKQHLDAARRDVTSHNAQIRSTIDAAWKQRREQLSAGKQNIESLGYPVRRREQAVAAAIQTPKAPPASKRTQSARRTPPRSMD